MRAFIGFAAMVVLAAVLACNEVPVRNLTSSYVVQVQQLKERGSPAKLDILWVVDDSSSMCQEQASLAASFNAFLDVFRKYTSIDMRVAVTTTNVCPKDKPEAVRGKFLYAPSTIQPADCRETRVLQCLQDSDCQKYGLPDSQNWVCKTDGAANLYTCDKPAGYGSDPYPGDLLYVVNSTCRYACDRDKDPAACARLFGEPSACEKVCGSAGGCSANECLNQGTLTSPNSCGSICEAGADCESRCVAVLKDTAACAQICGSADCFAACLRASKAPHCAQVCETSWGCKSFCEAYLHDPAGCDAACTAADCFGTCKGKFPGQDFLCAVACEGATSCSDRCIAEFGASSYHCFYPGGDKQQAGCFLSPPTAYCPPASLFADCKNRCEVLLSRPELGDLDPARHCANICQGGATPPKECECNQIADAEARCKCLAERNPETGMPKCGSGVQCTAMERCLSWIPPTIEAANPLSHADQATREAECASVSIPVLDSVVAERFFQAYRAGKWAGDPAWRGLDDATVRNLVFEQLFICEASVGAIQTLCGSQEQGLLAAWMALDPQGENAEQARTFLRDDAYLLIVAISDEDDCSSVDKVSLIDVGKCPCFADKRGCKPDGTCDPAAPGPLYPAEWFVNFFKSLKPDPAQVVFSAIVGDVVPESSTSPSKDVDAIRQRFFECKCDKGAKAVNTYACLSNQGKADLGARYIRVAKGFGSSYGQTSNICDDRGLRPSLENIARLVIPLLNRICLPRPVTWPCLTTCEATFGNLDRCKQLCLAGQEECASRCESLFQDPDRCGSVCAMPNQVEVYLTTADGQRHGPLIPESAEHPDDWDYTFDRNAPQCEKFDAAAGYRTENAIRFSRPLEPSDQVEIVYLTEPFYEP